MWYNIIQSFRHTNSAVLSLPTRLTDTLSIPALSMLFTGWMACLFVTSGPFPPLLTLATSSNTHTMGAAGNGANLWNESQSDREKIHLLPFIIIDYIFVHAASSSSQGSPIGCVNYHVYQLLPLHFKAVSLLFCVFLSFLHLILNIQYMDILEFNPNDFLCCWRFMLVHSWLLHCTMTGKLRALFLLCLCLVWSCVHTLHLTSQCFDQWHGCCRSSRFVSSLQ